jgi:hypothetical protein
MSLLDKKQEENRQGYKGSITQSLVQYRLEMAAYSLRKRILQNIIFLRISLNIFLVKKYTKK